MENTIINIRIPEALRDEYDKVIVPALRKETGIQSITRTDAIIKAMDEMAKRYRG